MGFKNTILISCSPSQCRSSLYCFGHLYIYFSQSYLMGSEAHPTTYTMDLMKSLTKGKTHHSPPLTTEIKIAWKLPACPYTLSQHKKNLPLYSLMCTSLARGTVPPVCTMLCNFHKKHPETVRESRAMDTFTQCNMQYMWAVKAANL